MASYSQRTEIIQLKEEILTNYRKIRNQGDNLEFLWDETELSRTALIFLINQAREMELTPEEAGELKEILVEVDGFRQTVSGEIRTKFANL